MSARTKVNDAVLELLLSAVALDRRITECDDDISAANEYVEALRIACTQYRVARLALSLPPMVKDAGVKPKPQFIERSATEMGWLRRGDLRGGEYDVWEMPGGILCGVPRGQMPVVIVGTEDVE